MKSRGKPEEALEGQERNKTINILADVEQALRSNEITRLILLLSGEDPTKERIEHAIRLVRQ